MTELPQWLIWAQKLDALAQAGLTFTKNPFDIERYHKIRELSSEIISTYSQISFPEVTALMDAQAGYPTPKLDIRGVIFKDDRILLVKELMDGGWTMPGGWVDVDEPPSRAVEREVWEESGYLVRAARLLAIYDRNKHGFPAYIFHSYKVYIQCDLIGGEAANSIETGGAEFFDISDLPPLSLPRTTPDVIQRMADLYHHPEAPADFD
jgi:ADP-ribose pyrophosphatase YjhB (NUDIX family)